MKNKYLLRSLLPIAALFHAIKLSYKVFDSFIFYNNASVAAITAPTSTLLKRFYYRSCYRNRKYRHVIDFAGGTGQNFNIDNFNARNGDVSGTHLRYNYPINGNVKFNLPTTGYNNVVVKFTTRRSGSGAGKSKLVLLYRRNYFCALSDYYFTGC